MRVLVVAPHADDEVLGVGGTIARYAAEGHDVVVAILTGHGEDGPHPLGPKEIWDVVRREAKQAHGVLGVKETIFEEIPAVGVADQALWKLNKTTMDVMRAVSPDVVYVPFLYDVHKDHRELAHSFSVTWRPCTETGRKIREVFAYETVSETHWNLPYLEPGFFPNHWVDVGGYLHKKLEALECFTSQMRPFPDARSLEAVEALARWRGSQMGLCAAEAFVMLRTIRPAALPQQGPPTPSRRFKAGLRRDPASAALDGKPHIGK
jgi:LmbE family N-acetylglucosaminyl deacetylase